MPVDRVSLIRQYAEGAVSWHFLRDHGFNDYVEVLAALGELGLKPPVAKMEGPNIAARQRGHEMLRKALQDQSKR